MTQLTAKEIYEQVVVKYIDANDTITSTTAQKMLWTIKHNIAETSRAPSLEVLSNSLDRVNGFMLQPTQTSLLHFFSGGQGRDRVYSLLTSIMQVHRGDRLTPETKEQQLKSALEVVLKGNSTALKALVMDYLSKKRVEVKDNIICLDDLKSATPYSATA